MPTSLLPLRRVYKGLKHKYQTTTGAFTWQVAITSSLSGVYACRLFYSANSRYFHGCFLHVLVQ